MTATIRLVIAGSRTVYPTIADIDSEVGAWAMGTRSPSEQSEAALLALGFEPPALVR